MSCSRSYNTESIVKELSPHEIDQLEVPAVDDPVLFAYAFEKCERRKLSTIDAESSINVMNNGSVPVFSYDNAIYIVLHKGRNWSQGAVHGKVDQDDPKLALFTYREVNDSSLMLWRLSLE